MSIPTFGTSLQYHEGKWSDFIGKNCFCDPPQVLFTRYPLEQLPCSDGRQEGQQDYNLS